MRGRSMANQATSVDKIIGKNLRAIREIKGYSQTAVGSSLAPTVTFQQIQKYETGVNRIAASTLIDIASVLKCSLADLISGATENPSAALSSEDIKLLKVFKSIRTPELRIQAISIISEMSKL